MTETAGPQPTAPCRDTSAVKIPADWLRVPRFASRSDLYEARQHEMHQLALTKTKPSPYFDRAFGRHEAVARDTFRKSGAFAADPHAPLSAASPDPRDFHAMAVTSGGFSTRSSLLAQRGHERRLESLRFEPPEIMRLRDIPKPGAPELQQWWTRSNGYVVDPSPMLRDSLRLALNASPKRKALGPMDPAKIRSPVSVNECRQLQQIKTQLAEKITTVTPAQSEDCPALDRMTASVVTRASDLYAQERRPSEEQQRDWVGGMSSSASLTVPISPIKPTSLRSAKKSRRHAENLFAASTNQRVQLDYIKSCPPLSPVSPAARKTINTASASAQALASSSSSSDNTLHSVKDYRGSIRCGGFT